MGSVLERIGRLARRSGKLAIGLNRGDVWRGEWINGGTTLSVWVVIINLFLLIRGPNHPNFAGKDYGRDQIDLNLTENNQDGGS